MTNATGRSSGFVSPVKHPRRRGRSKPVGKCSICGSPGGATNSKGRPLRHSLARLGMRGRACARCFYNQEQLTKGGLIAPAATTLGADIRHVLPRARADVDVVTLRDIARAASAEYWRAWRRIRRRLINQPKGG